MLRIDQATAQQATAGTWLVPVTDASREVVGLSTDSRQISSGAAFVALKGPNFDGHAYVDQAQQNGASLLILQHVPERFTPHIPTLLVTDTKLALGDLASAWRQRVNPYTVAITGSMGKTTTKELVRLVLAKTNAVVHATAGNFNNEIGVPLTLAQMPADTRYLVLELGINAPGEMSYLTKLAQPHLCLITNVAPVHLEQLETVEQVAQQKLHITDALETNGTLIVPGDDTLLESIRQRHQAASFRVRRFGYQPHNDIRVLQATAVDPYHTLVTLRIDGQTVSFPLQLPGAHNALNAAAAAAVGVEVGLVAAEIAEALSEPVPRKHRSQVHAIGHWHVIDDTYNANPVAMQAALKFLSELAAANQQPSIAILGPMRELGADSARYHRELGGYVASLGTFQLVTIGDEGKDIAVGAAAAGMAPEQIVALSQPGEAAAWLMQNAPAAATILVKGSRSAQLDIIIDRLLAEQL